MTRVPEPAQHRLGLTQAPYARKLLVSHLGRNALQIAQAAHRVQVAPLTRHDRARRPLPAGREAGQTPQLGDDGLRLGDWSLPGRQHLDPTLCDRVQLGPLAAVRFLRPGPIDVDRVSALHSLSGRFYHLVGGCDDMAGGAVVVGEEAGSRPVVRLETTDELHRRAVEGVDILVVITDGEETELVLFF